MICFFVRLASNDDIVGACFSLFRRTNCHFSMTSKCVFVFGTSNFNPHHGNHFISDSFSRLIFISDSKSATCFFFFFLEGV